MFNHSAQPVKLSNHCDISVSICPQIWCLLLLDIFTNVLHTACIQCKIPKLDANSKGSALIKLNLVVCFLDIRRLPQALFFLPPLPLVIPSSTSCCLSCDYYGYATLREILKIHISQALSSLVSRHS